MLSFLIEKEVKQMLRDSLLPKMMIALPMMSMFVFPFAANQEIRNIRATVIDSDRSTISSRLIGEMDASDYFDISAQAATYAEALRDVESGRSDMIVEFPGGLEKSLVRGETARVLIAANAVNGTKGTLGTSYMMSMLSGSTVLLETARKSADASVASQAADFSVSPAWKFNPSLDYKVFMVPALIVMLLTVICGFFPALNIVNEKEQGTIEQMNVTPVGKVQFILAKMIPLWICGIVILGFCLIAGRIVYGLVPAGSVLTILLFAGIYILVVSGMGLVVSNYAATMQQAMFVMFFFVMILLLMSGLFTPVGSMPGWARAVAAVNPLTYFIQVMRLVYLKGSSFRDMLPQFLALCGFALAFGAASVLSYRKSG